MLGQTNQLMALAEVNYRHERFAAEFARSPRTLHLKWPVGLLSPKRRSKPRHPSGLRPAPHHMKATG
jgi:hypothetical protein